MDTQHRLRLFQAFRREKDPARRTVLGLEWLKGELEFLVPQLDPAHVTLDRAANALRDLAAEIQAPPGATIIRADDPPLPLSGSDFPPLP